MKFKFSKSITENLTKKSYDVPTDEAGMRKLLEYMQDNTKKHKHLAKGCFVLDQKFGTKFQRVADVLKFVQVNAPKQTGKFVERPLNFWVSTLNIDPKTPQGLQVIQRWARAEIEFLESQGQHVLYASLHLNESTPHIHVCTANWIKERVHIKRRDKKGQIVEYEYHTKRFGTSLKNDRKHLRAFRKAHRDALSGFLTLEGLKLAPKGTETTLSALYKAGNAERFKAVLRAIRGSLRNEGYDWKALARLEQIENGVKDQNLAESAKQVADIIQPPKEAKKEKLRGNFSR